MKKNQLVTCCVLVAFIAGLPLVCGAQSARVIPKGTLSVVENGKTVGEFQSEVPLPQGASLVCSGECLVQGENFQLLAHDKTQFSLAKKGKVWVLTVKSGTVEFSMSEDAKLAFVTPKGRYEVTKAIPDKGLVRGCVDVSAAGTKFATAAGVLYLASAEGVLELQPSADACADHRAAIPPPAFAGGAAIPTGAIVAGGALAAGGVAAGVILATQHSKPPVSPY